jgi:SPOR domain
MATNLRAPLTEDAWHLSIDDLLAPLPEKPRLGGTGPFVINLSSSTAGISAAELSFAGICNAHSYAIQRNEDGRTRYRLRLGSFETEDEADRVLALVRETYPGALTATAGPDDVKALASIRAKAGLNSNVPTVTPSAPINAASVVDAPAAAKSVVVKAPVTVTAPVTAPVLNTVTVPVPAKPAAAAAARPVVATPVRATPVRATPVRSTPVVAAPPMSTRAPLPPVARATPRAPAAAVRPPPARPNPTVGVPSAAAAAARAAAIAFTSPPAAPASPPASPPAPPPAQSSASARPLSTLDSTQTVRTLTTVDLDDGALPWFVIQLSQATEPFDPDTVPNLDIFSVYRLYCVAEIDKGQILHCLRVGFFTAEIAASAVASYLTDYYEKPLIKRVSVAERERFADQRVDARKDVGATGRHAVIEITDERIVRRQRLVHPTAMP